MKARYVLAVLALGLAGTAVGSSSAYAATAPFDPTLGIEARYALDSSLFETSGSPTKQVYARCYASDRYFEDAHWWRFGEPAYGIWAYAIRSEKTIYLRPGTCRAAHRLITKMQTGTTYKATEDDVFGYATLLHEALHVQGIGDEQTVDCLANDSVRWAASGMYRIRQSEANRLSRMAFNVKRKRTAPKYWSVSGECQRMLRDTDWSHYVGW